MKPKGREKGSRNKPKKQQLLFGGDPPWKGIGKPVGSYSTARDVLNATGLDWRVTKLPMCAVYPDTQQMVYLPGKYAIVRTKDNQFLNAVGKRYAPVQNEDAITWLMNLSHKTKLTLEAAGELYGGQYVFCIARTEKTITLPGGDALRVYVVLCHPHVGDESMSVHLMLYRMIGLCGPVLPTGLTVRHRLSTTEQETEDLQAVQRIDEMVAECTDSFSRLAETKYKEADLLDWLAKALPDSLRKGDTPHRAYFKDSGQLFLQVLEQQPGRELDSMNGTWWAAYAALCFYVDHLCGHDRDASLHSAWFGRRATMKKRALEAALAYCE